MSIGLRVRQKRNMLFYKEFKAPLRKIADIMPVGFSDEDFYAAFRKYYPNLITKAEEVCLDNKRHSESRKKHGHKTAYFPFTAERFLIERSAGTRRALRSRHAVGKNHTYEEIAELTKALDRGLARRMAKRQAKEDYYLQYGQDVCPDYIKSLIRTYFAERKRSTLDVNARYILLLEAAQFRTPETVEFLKKINACDKNNDLRQFAFNTLQSMGYNPWLAKNRKGKVRDNAIKPIDITENPTELLEYVYRYQNRLHKHFDVFLSHSSYDKSELYRLKRILNAQGLVVYIDWANDKVMLNRRNQNEDTWTVLQKRMDISDKMVFVMTDNSLRSEWCTKEIDYFKGKGKEIYIFQPSPITETVWDSLNGLPTCNLENNKITF